MKAYCSVFLFFISCCCHAQAIDPRAEFLDQLSKQLMSSFSGEDSRTIIASEKIRWDTTDALFRAYLCKFDTSNYNCIEMKHRRTRNTIFSTMRIFNDDDYATFKQQVNGQYDITFLTIPPKKKMRKKQNVSTISFSQPLISSDRKKIVCVYALTSESGYTKIVSIYRRNDVGVWVEYLNLERTTSCYLRDHK